MPERTARAFFTTTWRALAERLQAVGNNPQAQAIYDDMMHMPDGLSVYWHFEEGLALALEQLPLPLVLCFDEFDEAYRHLEPQTFLNLRALRDRHGEKLVYVTSTERELARLTTTREQGELYELIMPRVRYMHLMEPQDTHDFCQAFAAREQVTFSKQDIEFIRQNADGHPGLALAVCYALGAVTGAPVRNPQQDRVIHQGVQSSLSSDATVQAECAKIWDDLEADERQVLLHLQHAEANAAPADAAARHGLNAKSIVYETEDGPRVFCPLFEDYVRRQMLIQQPDQPGVYIDVDAGAVWVEGKPVETLTDLEYRLLLYLYGRIERVCDKYGIVETVWGQDYIDKVDDTRIEKLVSRLRQKIEPDPGHPHYLLSLRGRGYKLVR